MGIEDFMRVTTFGIETAMIVAAPVLLMGLAAGLMVSVFQAATQINDAALAFIPKILATVLALFYFGPWMISKMAAFATFALGQIPHVTG
ncbi:MAG: flagellar biosynthetic protein FliQ [Bdellovibrionales bacterium]|nr:flagellar biosynthetic protein FliQ [Bdellovibrionales bacterium]